MLKFKKGLILILALAVVLTTLAVPFGTSAEEITTTVIEDTFENYTLFPGNGYTKVDKGVEVVASGNEKYGKVLGLGASVNSGVHGISKEINKTEGTVKISFDVKLGQEITTTNSAPFLQLFADSATPQSFELLRAYNRPTGNKDMPGGITLWIGENSWVNIAKEKIAFEWLKVEATINLDTDILNMTVTGDDGKVLWGEGCKTDYNIGYYESGKDMNIADKLSNVKELRLINQKDVPVTFKGNNADSANYIDNLVIEDENGILLSDDFESYGILSDIQGVTATPGIFFEESSEEGRGKILNFGNQTVSAQQIMTVPVEMNAGVLEINYDVKIGCLRNPSKLILTTSEGKYIVPVTIFENMTTKRWSMGYYAGGVMSPDQSWNWFNDGDGDGSYDSRKSIQQGEWVNVKVIVDLDNRNVSITATEADGVKIVNNSAIALDASIKDIAKLTLGQERARENGEAGVYHNIDNLKITKTVYQEAALPAGVYIDQDFEDLTNISEWASVSKHSEVSLVDYGEGRGNVIDLGNTKNQGISKTVNKNDGRLNLSFAAAVGHDATNPDRLMINAKKADGTGFQIAQIYTQAYTDNDQAKERWAAILPNVAGESATSWNAMDWSGTWFDMDIQIDFDNKRVFFYAVGEGGIRLTKKSITLSDSVTDIASIEFVNDKNIEAPYEIYLDDILLSDEIYKPTVLWEENFDSKSLNDVDNVSFTNALVEFAEATEGDAHGRSLKFGKSGTGAAEMEKMISSTDEDCLKITYDLYNNGIAMPVMIGNINGTENYIAYINANKLYRDNTQSKKVADLPENAWVTVEHIVNMEKNTNKITVKDSQGNTLGTDTGALAADSVSVNRIAVRVWSESGNYAYVDDIKIEPYVEVPALSDAAVSMTDYKGDAIADIKKVTPGISTIVLDFGASVKEDSLSGIKLELIGEKENVPTAFEGELIGSEYTMSVNGLAQNSVYKLTVPKTVANKAGTTMTEDYVLDFVTVAGNKVGRLVSVMDGNEPATLESIVAGDTLTINAAFENTTGSTMTVEYLVAYYSGDALLGVRSANETATMNGAGNIGETITVENINMESVTEIKVFMWDSVANGVPYCEPIVINQ